MIQREWEAIRERRKANAAPSVRFFDAASGLAIGNRSALAEREFVTAFHELGYIRFRQELKGWHYEFAKDRFAQDAMTPSRKPVALVTGANKGIGFEVARAIAESGYVVLLGARNPTTGREAAGMLTSDRLDVRFVELDVTRMETISAAAARIEADFGKLDVLVNNAGIADAHDGPPSRASIDVMERVLRTNFLGAVAVTQAVLPLLRKSHAGRIVNVSSDLGSITRHGDATWKYANVKVLGYCASKAALNMFTVQLAFELRDQGIAVNSVNPGFTATDLNAHRGRQTVKEGAAEIVRVALLAHGPSGKFLETGGELVW